MFTEEQKLRMQANGTPKTDRDNSKAFASHLACKAATMQDDVLGIKSAMQAEADLMVEIVEYRRLMGSGR